MPIVLLIHIPMYAPGKNISFGCGNPFWGAETDRNFELERRPKWPKNGHTKTTFEFYKKVFDSSNVIGIFAGHIHRNSIEIIKGKPQIVSDDNASGAYLDIGFKSPTWKKSNHKPIKNLFIVHFTEKNNSISCLKKSSEYFKMILQHLKRFFSD